MSETTFHFYLVLAGFGMAAVVFAALFFVSAPYGRHTRQGWGIVLPNHIGWILMEAPSAIFFAFYFFTGSAPKNLSLVLFFCMWEIHYLHRAFIYPLTIRDGHKRMPLSVMLMGVFFNTGNTYVNGRYLFTLSGGYPVSWVTSPQFLIGAGLFIAGLITNRWADTVLRGLRKPGEEGYHIPYGSLFNLVSCPNYLGEIIEWTGWAIATWSLPGLAFAVWTFANLAPRARSHHAWYHKNFPGYPPQRRALFPGIW
jgi:3-oxo-5-alpha-steroid 4-dehydrogenase 1